MKTLATCTPTEFLSQTVRIRRSVEKWLTVTDIINIRKRTPEQLPVEKGSETARANFEENVKRRKDQVWKNLLAIFDACAEGHPAETLEVLALICFVEPQNVNDYTMGEYLTSISEMIGDESVLSFFTSLAKWAATGISVR